MNRDLPVIKPVPANLLIRITRIVRRKAMGQSTEPGFAAQLERLKLEEFRPLGLSLLFRNLDGGRTRFLVTDDSSGAISAMVDFAADGTLEIGRFDSVENGYISGASPVVA